MTTNIKITKRQYDTWLNGIFGAIYTKTTDGWTGRRAIVSPILNLKCTTDGIPGDYRRIELPLSLVISSNGINNYDSGISLNSLRVFSANQIEKTILHTVCRTKFESLSLVRGRYDFDFTKFHPHVIKHILDFILSAKFDRINYSWVPPLQDLYLNMTIRVVGEQPKKRGTLAATLDRITEKKTTRSWSSSKSTLSKSPVVVDSFDVLDPYYPEPTSIEAIKYQLPDYDSMAPTKQGVSKTAIDQMQDMIIADWKKYIVTSTLNNSGSINAAPTAPAPTQSGV